MAVQLDSVVPFGRSLEEYKSMFMLSGFDLERAIVGVGDGPASFNAELSGAGGDIISIDPLYRFSGEAIKQRFDEVVDDIIEQVRATPDDWVWNFHESPDALRRARIGVMERFVEDFPRGMDAGRYVIGELPILPFADARFDLALCSHLLFLYSNLFGDEFHYLAILEMLRLADEVRIFPLVTLDLAVAPCLDEVVSRLSRNGLDVAVRPVEYELQRGGNEMLVIRRGCG